MRWRVIAVLLLSAAATGCDAVLGSEDRVTRIGWGSSFGMCGGYCLQQLDVTPTEARLTQSSWNSQQYPPMVSTQPLTTQAWPALRGSLDETAFLGLQETYGCPDCADGGAEWVEVQYGGSRKRVTFEYGHSPQPLAAAVTYLRAIHGTFSMHLFDARAPGAVGGLAGR